MSDKPYTEEWLEGPESTEFYTRTYRPTEGTDLRAAIVFIHGFAEHVGRYTHFHPLLAKQGVAVFALDQRGFGLTVFDTSGKKSADSAYGKTSWEEQMKDIQWALTHAKGQFPDVPLFLMGHSMGGGEVLGFSTDLRNKEHLSQLSGVIATSPLIAQATPASPIAKWLGSKASILFPNLLIPVDLDPADLSHDDAFNKAYMNDPMIRQTGGLKGLSDMLSKGEEIRDRRYKDWPPALPILIIHGTEDKITSYPTSKKFVTDIPATTKRFESIEGGYHELQNEPNGVKEKVSEIILEFVEDTTPSKAGFKSLSPKANL